MLSRTSTAAEGSSIRQRWTGRCALQEMGKRQNPMKKTALTLIAIAILSILTQASPVTSLNNKEYICGTTSVYGIDGYALNLSLSVKQSVFTANSTIIYVTLQVFEPFSARGNIVNEDDYSISRNTLGYYLVSGVVVDYDRVELIDTLWLNWGDSENSSHIEEEKSLYSQIFWANFTKSYNVYFGTAVIPKFSDGEHNATVWVRAEQDQITTYIPFWIAFSQTIALGMSQTPFPEPTNPTSSQTANFPATLIFVALLGTASVIVGLLVHFKKPKP